MNRKPSVKRGAGGSDDTKGPPTGDVRSTDLTAGREQQAACPPGAIMPTVPESDPNKKLCLMGPVGSPLPPSLLANFAANQGKATTGG